MSPPMEAGRLLACAERLRSMARLLADQLTSERRKSSQRRDAEHRLLFVGDDGRPTHESTAQQFVRARSGEVLFRSPDDPSLGLTQLELWEQHFIQKPHGDRQLEAWVRDMRNAQYTIVSRPPWMQSALADPGLASQRELDVRQLLGEVAQMSSRLMADTPPHALALEVLDGCRACLAEHAAALGGPPVHDPETEPSARLILANTSLSPALLEVAIRHPMRSLTERVRLAGAMAEWLAHPSSGPTLDSMVRPSLRDVLQATAARHADTLEALDRDDYVARVVALLLDAEAMIDRAQRVDAESVGPVEDFAVQGLSQALRGLTR